MIITTTTQNEATKEITSCSLFDTQTGIQYSLDINRNVKYGTPVKVEIHSAHARENENDYPGISYSDKEALHFWQQLVETLPGLDTVWTGEAERAAAKILSDIAFATTKPQPEVVSTYEIDDEDIPF